MKSSLSELGNLRNRFKTMGKKEQIITMVNMLDDNDTLSLDCIGYFVDVVLQESVKKQSEKM